MHQDIRYGKGTFVYFDDVSKKEKVVSREEVARLYPRREEKPDVFSALYRSRLESVIMGDESSRLNDGLVKWENISGRQEFMPYVPERGKFLRYKEKTSGKIMLKACDWRPVVEMAAPTKFSLAERVSNVISSVYKLFFG
ncbi:MAG TPA: hypothetical protein VFE88_03110 [Candidatus Nanoarchaeia archaeon]|nr:hypothetical protein [Candidatus Nanoarchaeia archaeon]